MDYFLRGLLPRILPPDYLLDINCFIRPHEGKSHLQKSIPRKMKSYPHFGYAVKVLVVHDQDANDCRKLKQALIDQLSTQTAIPSLVRIACRELENWYLGDLDALQEVLQLPIGDRVSSRQAKFRLPDLLNGTEEVKRLTGNFSKIQVARHMGRIISLESNQSQSFGHFITGLNKILNIN